MFQKLLLGIFLLSPSCYATYVEEKAHTIEISEKVHQEAITPELGRIQLEGILTDYTDPKGQLESLAKFLRETIKLSNFSIEANQLESWSGETSFRVLDSDTYEATTFIKMFEAHSKNLFSEIFGLELLLAVEDLSSPQIRAVGKCYSEGKCFFLIAESVIPGNTMQFYYNAVGESPKRTLVRRKALQTVRQGVTSLGKGLARLHALRQGEQRDFPNELISAVHFDLAKAIKKLELYPQEGIDITQLQNYCNELISNLKAESHFVGVAHNDVKLMHTFYSPQTKECALVDPSHLAQSIDLNGNPQGLPARDYQQFVTSLKLNRFGYFLDEDLKPYRKELLTEDEANSMVHAFKKSYLKSKGRLPTALEEEFLWLKHDLWFIANCLGDLSKSQIEPWVTRLKDLAAVSVNNLKKNLKIYELKQCLFTRYYLDPPTVEIICSKFKPLVENCEYRSVVDDFIAKSQNLPLSNIPSTATSLHEFDATTHAADFHSVLFENTQMRILWGVTKAGEQEPFHVHQWDSLMVILQGSTFCIENLDGSKEYGEWPIGVYELPAESTPSAYSNIGLSDFENLRFEIK